MNSRWAVALVAGLMALAPVAGKDKEEDKPGDAEVVATVNGEPVTKSEWASIWKADQWHAPSLKTKAKFAPLMQGRPYEDFFFREEVVKIRAMAQKYSDSLPQMRSAIDEIHRRAKAGEDFGELAKQLSQDPSAAAGGDLGEKEFHDLVFPFNRVALALKPGEFSEPLLSVYGYHIAKVDRVLPPQEGKGKKVQVRHILIRYPATDPGKEAETLATQAKIEVLDKGLCKKLPSYCRTEG